MSDKMALAILGMGKTKREGMPIAVPEDESGDDPVHAAAIEVLRAVKANDGVALAEALRAAVMSLRFEEPQE